VKELYTEGLFWCVKKRNYSTRNKRESVQTTKGVGERDREWPGEIISKEKTRVRGNKRKRKVSFQWRQHTEKRGSAEKKK